MERRMTPLFADEVAAPAKASMLSVVRCDPQFAREGVKEWHSRLPITQIGPWKMAFAAHYEWTCFGVALWNNPSARTLPSDWLELRRLAVAPDAPHCTASRMLGQMARWIWANVPGCDTLISYQDCDVHTGTIYRAAGWEPAYISKPRTRDRSKARVGTRRDYRNNLNGSAPDSAAKIRWQLSPNGKHSLQTNTAVA